MGLGRLPSLLLGVAFILSAQPKIGPDEFRAHSTPYVPPPPPNTIKTEVKVVEVPVVVRDGKHRAVPGLTQSDFQVLDAGKAQPITMFSVETGPAIAAETKSPVASPTQTHAAPPPAEVRHPRFIGLVFDNVSSSFADLKYTKDAAEKFVRNGLAPEDRVAVFTTAFAPPTVTFTDEVLKLIESIDKVTPQPRYSDNDSSCPRITGYQAYLISNNMDPETLEGVAQEDMACKNIRHDLAVQEVTSLAHARWEHAMAVSRNTLYSIGGVIDTLGKMPGRRMLLLASSGFLSGNLEYLLDDMTTKALHAEVVINTLDAKGLYTLTPGRPIDAPPVRGRSVRTQIAEASIQSRQASAKDDGMASLALGTGGAFYHNSNDLDKGFHDLGTIPDVVYVLGFSPSDAAPDGRYHPLKVKLTANHHYSLQSRMGYTAPSKNPSAPEQRQPSRLDTEAMATDTLDEVPVSLAWIPAKPENGNPSVNVAVHLDVKHLKFDTRTDRRTLKLTYIVNILSAGGAFIAGRQGEIELTLKPETYDALSPDGMNVMLPLQAPAGTYTLRGVVQEGIDGKISASSLPLELR